MGAAAMAAAAMRKREQDVIDDFRAAGATSPQQAQSYEPSGHGESLALRRLKNRAVIREAAPGTFYLDELVWAAVRRTRMRLVLTLIAVLAVLLAGILLGVIKQ
jgi:hypothetical protein